MGPDAEIMLELDLPMASFRLFALEKAIQTGSSPELLAALEGRTATEDDEECRMMLVHAIRAVRQKLAGPREPAAPVEDVMFEKAWQAGDPEARIELLRDLQIEQRRRLVSKAPDWLKAERDPMVAMFLVQTFGQFWPKDKLEILKQLLTAPRLGTRLAAMEVLTTKAPQMLTQALPRLLMSEDFRIRALAVKGLAKIDLEEALSNFEFLLTDQDPASRIGALQISIYLPYSRIKPMLMKAAAMETNMDLLGKIGALLVTNPDVELPYEIWEIYDAVPALTNPVKSATLEKIYQAACQIVRSSGVLEGEDFQVYMTRLHDRINKKSAMRLVREWLPKIEACDAVRLAELKKGVAQLIHRAFVRETLEETLGWPIADHVKAKVRDILRTFPPKTGPAHPAGNYPRPPQATGPKAPPIIVPDRKS